MAQRRASSAPAVVLVGRPNVGKSTLFNRITNSRRSIVTAIPGTTRDVISQHAEWQGVTFTLVDTGGMFGASEDPLHELVVAAGQRALESADVVVFVVDGRDGLVPADLEIAERLRVGERTRLARGQQDRRQACPRPCRRVLPAWIRTGRGNRGRARARGRRSPRRDDRATARAWGGWQPARRPAGNRCRHCRASKRRQVLAAEPAAARGAIDRERHARDDSRHGRCGAQLASSHLPDRRHCRNPACRARRPQRPARVSERRRGATRDREGGRCRPRRSTPPRERPIRTRRSLEKQRRPAAASSSSPTNGI